jgi:hypothetical protein
MSEMQVPFDFAQGRLSTPLRFAQNDSKDGAGGASAYLPDQ